MINENKRFIANLIKVDGITTEEIYSLIAVPPTPDMGDFTLPCFKFAKALRKSPVMIAKELAESISVCGNVTKIEAVNGYLNF